MNPFFGWCRGMHEMETRRMDSLRAAPNYWTGPPDVGSDGTDCTAEGADGEETLSPGGAAVP
jgi:hypothetical protein